jgi:hypothetical protein
VLVFDEACDIKKGSDTPQWCECAVRAARDEWGDLDRRTGGHPCRYCPFSAPAVPGHTHNAGHL